MAALTSLATLKSKVNFFDCIILNDFYPSTFTYFDSSIIYLLNFLFPVDQYNVTQKLLINYLNGKQQLHTSCVCFKSGQVKRTLRKNKPINYEKSLGAHDIGHNKAWNSWNTCKYLISPSPPAR